MKLIKVLDENDIKRCQNLIESLKEYYTPLPDGFYFETLGAASYLHFGNEHEGEINECAPKYYSIKNKSNPILIKNFKWLYDKVCLSLSKELYKPCDISDESGLAFPGFHLFYPYEGCEEVSHPAHLDCQWMYHVDRLKNIYKEIDYSEFLTFTLSIKLPKNGGGLYYWSLPKEDEKYTFEQSEQINQKVLEKARNLISMSDGSLPKEDYEKEVNPSVLEYKEGYMTFFTQPILHQIMPFNNNWKKDDIRITLQGHGILCDDIWRLYF